MLLNQFLHFTFIGIRFVPVGNDQIFYPRRLFKYVIEKFLRIRLGHRLVVGLEFLDLAVLIYFQSLPIGHQSFDEVIGSLIIGDRKLRGVGRIEISQIYLDLSEYLQNIFTISLILLLVVED